MGSWMGSIQLNRRVMKKILLALALLFAVPSGAAISVVFNSIGVCTNTATTFTTPSVTSSGSVMIVAVADYAFVAAGTLSDNKGNSYTLIGTYNDAAVGNAAALSRIRIYYCASATTGASHTWTITSGGASHYPAVACIGINGSNGVNAGLNGNSSTTLTASASTGTITLTSPTDDGRIIISAVCGGGSSNPAPTLNAASVSQGWAVTNSTGAVSNQHVALALAYWIQGTATTTGCTWDFGTSTKFAMMVTTFQPTAVPVYSGGIFFMH